MRNKAYFVTIRSYGGTATRKLKMKYYPASIMQLKARKEHIVASGLYWSTQSVLISVYNATHFIFRSRTSSTRFKTGFVP